MGWQKAAQVGSVVLASLGGGGAIVYCLSPRGVLGRVWVDRLRGDIDRRLQRLECRAEAQEFRPAAFRRVRA